MNNLNLQNIRNKNSELSPEQNDELISTLKIRFEKNTNRHKTIDWAAVELKLQANPGKLWTLHEMEKTGGEPDIVHYDKKSLNIFFMIFPQKVQQAEEACVSIVQQWNPERRTSL